MTGLAALLLLAAAPGLAIEGSEDRAAAAATGHFGSAVTAFPIESLYRVRGEATTLVVEAEAPVADRTVAFARAGLVSALIRLPAGGGVEAAVAGNPSLGLRRSWTVTPRFSAHAELELAVPVGGGAADPTASLDDNRALAIADALTGYAHPGTFTPGRWTASAGLGGEGRWERVRASCALSLRLASTLGREADGPGRAVRALGLAMTAGISASVRLVWRLQIVTRAWMVWEPWPVVAAVGRPESSNVAIVAAPALALALSPGSRVELGGTAHVRNGFRTEAFAITGSVALSF